jgi:hypothetical protein
MAREPWCRYAPPELSLAALSIAAILVRDHHEEPAAGRLRRRENSMKQYLLSVHMVEGAPGPSEAQAQQMYQAVEAFNTELRASGEWVFAGGLLPPDTSTVVRAQGGKVVTTDGPFAETKEQLGGFWVVQAADLDAALAIAARGSAACRGPDEVRPFQEIPEQ